MPRLILPLTEHVERHIIERSIFQKPYTLLIRVFRIAYHIACSRKEYTEIFRNPWHTIRCLIRIAWAAESIHQAEIHYTPPNEKERAGENPCNLQRNRTLAEHWLRAQKPHIMLKVAYRTASRESDRQKVTVREILACTTTQHLQHKLVAFTTYLRRHLL